jgi:hypothetical protein
MGGIKKIVPGTVWDFLPKDFRQWIVIENNKDIGKAHEKLSSRLFIDSLKEKIDMSKFTVQIDKDWFHCFNENTSRRRYDIFIKELLVGFEIKSSRVVYNKFVRKQIQKDKWLLDNNKVNEVRWILYNGATKNVMNSLTKNEIMYLDITGNIDNFTNITQIYHEKNGLVLTSKGIPVIPL